MLVDAQALKRAKDRLRALTSRRWGVSMERRIDAINRFTVGWTAYFRLADTPTVFEELDKWLRRRLRQVRWKEWKRVRTRRRKLRALGISETNARQWATSRKGYWRIAGSKVLAVAMPNGYWTDLGLQGFLDPYRRFRDATRTAGCGPARPVVWEAPGEPGAYPIRALGARCDDRWRVGRAVLAAVVWDHERGRRVLLLAAWADTRRV